MALLALVQSSASNHWQFKSPRRMAHKSGFGLRLSTNAVNFASTWPTCHAAAAVSMALKLRLISVDPAL